MVFMRKDGDFPWLMLVYQRVDDLFNSWSFFKGIWPETFGGCLHISPHTFRTPVSNPWVIMSKRITLEGYLKHIWIMPLRFGGGWWSQVFKQSETFKSWVCSSLVLSRCFCHPLVAADFSLYPNMFLHSVGATSSIGVPNKLSWFSTTHQKNIYPNTHCLLFFFGHDRCFQQMFFRVVVSNIFYVHPYLGKIPILTNIFQVGWNHQLVFLFTSGITGAVE